MPPKKGKELPKKQSKKEKKLYAKYGTVRAEDQSGAEVSLMGMRRDELEWAAERLREQVTVNREERVRFQLERDFLYDIMQSYWKKYKCIKTDEENKIAQTNRLTQDADDNKVIKSIEGKHFRYESQMMCTSMDVRDEIRKNKLKDMLEKSWQSIAHDIEDQNDILERNAEKYRHKIDETREKLDDLQTYVDDHANQLQELTKDLIQQMENSMKLFHLSRRMEFQMTEERWSEFIWKLSRNFELQYESMKNYYNDAAHSNLTLIFTLQDWMNDSIERMRMYQEKISECETLMQDAHAKMPALRTEYVKTKVKHDCIIRTKRGIKTTNKEVALALKAINQHKGEYRQLIHTLTSINAEREHLKNNSEDLIGDLMESCTFRFELEKQEQETSEEVSKMYDQKQRLLDQFPNPESFAQSVQPYKMMFDRKSEIVEQQKLRSMRVQKQSEDLRNSLEARLLKLGLKKKHQTVTPGHGAVIGRVAKLDWGPANLVSRKAYPTPKPPPVTLRCPITDEESDVKLCLTESIRGFLAWKDKQKLTKAKKHHEEQFRH